MNHLRQVILGIFCFGALSALLLFGLSISKGGLKGPPSTLGVGAPARDFSIRLLTGSGQEKISLSQWKGQTVVLNFWATWCGSCGEEAHELEAFWRKHQPGSEKPVVLLGIAIQDEGEKVLGFARSKGKTYPLALDETGEASLNYGVSGVPETFIIDGKGILKARYTGPVTGEELEDALGKL
jgi:cytochrome c biogenesis protein CcmG/thiol:disulfide interchange protein DsbE